MSHAAHVDLWWLKFSPWFVTLHLGVCWVTLPWICSWACHVKSLLQLWKVDSCLWQSCRRHGLVMLRILIALSVQLLVSDLLLLDRLVAQIWLQLIMDDIIGLVQTYRLFTTCVNQTVFDFIQLDNNFIVDNFLDLIWFKALDLVLGLFFLTQGSWVVWAVLYYNIIHTRHIHRLLLRLRHRFCSLGVCHRGQVLLLESLELLEVLVARDSRWRKQDGLFASDLSMIT